MSMPSGLLEWGQTGTYDAVDDRMVITALSGGVPGIVRSAVLAAGTGLNVHLHGGWLAIASAADGTSVVVGTASDTQFLVAAGGSAARTDFLWCDVSPDTAQWSLALIGSNEIAGRAGILLGTIGVPANASASSAFTFTPMAPTFGSPDMRTSVLDTAFSFTGTGDTPTHGHFIAQMNTLPSAASSRYVIHGQMLSHLLSGSGRFGMGLQCSAGLLRLQFLVTEQYGDGLGASYYGWSWSGTGPPRAWYIGNRVMTEATVYCRILIDGVVTINPTNTQPAPPSIGWYINGDNGLQLSVWDGSYASVEQVT